MPTRRLTKALETTPALEFEFFLAAKLHMTVDRLRRELSNDEFVHWGVYYARLAQRAEMERQRSA